MDIAANCIKRHLKCLKKIYTDQNIKYIFQKENKNQNGPLFMKRQAALERKKKEGEGKLLVDDFGFIGAEFIHLFMMYAEYFAADEEEGQCDSSFNSTNSDAAHRNS